MSAGLGRSSRPYDIGPYWKWSEGLGLDNDIADQRCVVLCLHLTNPTQLLANCAIRAIAIPASNRSSPEKKQKQ